MASICLYITAHGFGHASRCHAVAERLAEAGVRVELRTLTPGWFFEGLLDREGVLLNAPPESFDPGVVQSDSFHHDVPTTLARWRTLLDRGTTLINREADHLRRQGHDLALCDVAPLPLIAARQVGIPAVAQGNFTWDWVLSGYLDQEPGFLPVIEQIRRWYRKADLFLQLPLSHDTDIFTRTRSIGFTARATQDSPTEVRRRLGLADEHLMVLLSFGGLGVETLTMDQVPRHPEVRCVHDRGPGTPPHIVSADGLGLRYPDLIRAADVILTKPGYSIISEAVAHKTRLAYVPRSGFRESPLLEQFLRERWPSLVLSPTSLVDGSWIGHVVRWAREPADFPDITADGAERIAEILERLAHR